MCCVISVDETLDLIVLYVVAGSQPEINHVGSLMF